MKEHYLRIRNLKSGMKQAYSKIFQDYCTKDMQRQIEAHPDFASRTDDDPIVS